MSSAVNISARIDPATKEKAVDILNELGLTTTQAICIYFKQIIYNNGIPFELRVPNKATVDTFRKTDAGEDLHRVSNINELAKELKA